MVKKSFAEYREMPWANGRGTTRELYVYPEGTSIADGTADWRVSMADVTKNGHFSQLPNYDRFITLVQGRGFHLSGNHKTDQLVIEGITCGFSGSEIINCQLLRGACVDLNLFYRPDRISAIFRVWQSKPYHPTYQVWINPGSIMIVVLTRGSATVALAQDRLIWLEQADSLWLPASPWPRRLELAARDAKITAAVMHLTPI